MGTQAQVLSKSERGMAEEQRLMQQANSAGIMLTDFSQDANLNRKPDYFVYVYSIVARRFEVKRPPTFPFIVFEPCSPDEQYKLVGTFPSPVNESIWMEDRNFVTGIYGERFVMGVLNPGGANIDRPDNTMDNEASWSAATSDLTRRGLFMSLHKPPKAEEVQACRTKMEKHYRWLLQQGDQLERTNRAREIGPEHHLAAEHFGYKANWHYVQTAPTPCPNCGELVRTGLAYHINPAGAVCVLDWKRAVRAGVKTMEDVPENERWAG